MPYSSIRLRTHPSGKSAARLVVYDACQDLVQRISQVIALQKWLARLRGKREARSPVTDIRLAIALTESAARCVFAPPFGSPGFGIQLSQAGETFTHPQTTLKVSFAHSIPGCAFIVNFDGRRPFSSLINYCRNDAVQTPGRADAVPAQIPCLSEHNEYHRVSATPWRRKKPRR